MGLLAQLLSQGLNCRRQLQCGRELISSRASFFGEILPNCHKSNNSGFIPPKIDLCSEVNKGHTVPKRNPEKFFVGAWTSWHAGYGYDHSLQISMAYLPFFLPAFVLSHTNQWTNQVFIIFIGLKRLPSYFSSSGEPQSVEELWDEYFANPTQWWDNRAEKRNPSSPDFRHKVTRKALWIYGWSTPLWVQAMLKLAGDGKMHPRVDYRTKDSQDTTQGDRPSEGQNGKRSIVYRHIVQGGGGGIPMQGARSTIDAIGNIKNRLEQGMAIDSYMYVEVLRRCLKEKNLKVNVAKQVHDYINQVWRIGGCTWRV